MALTSANLAGGLGCSGVHHGPGTAMCPRYLHHHHDERCLFRAQELALKEAAATLTYTVNNRRHGEKLSDGQVRRVETWLLERAAALAHIDTPDSAPLPSTGEDVQSSSPDSYPAL